MLMLFLALAFLCGLMYLMTALIKDRPQAGAEGQRGARWRAAAIGVALARAEQDLSPVGATGTEEPVSAWWALHHQRQLTRNTPARRDQ